ncbi:MAG: hypothetical protein K1X94_28570 [Sandaracinaceae bacterium]|jgi:hypothetical protein|nr:hypothetical protein [Sandaracinaceae bacterium]
MSDESTNTESAPSDATTPVAEATHDEGAHDAGAREERHAEERHDDRHVEEPHEDLPARGADPRPYIVLTAIHDANARVAAITLSHADAWERAQKAVGGKAIAGMDLVELSVPPRAFTALREKLQRSPETCAVYDLFPLAAHLGRTTRKVAGQFLAAEILWALEEQGILAGIPLNIRLDVPRAWGDRSPKAVHEKLMEGGALDLTEGAIEDFRAIKGSWDQVS